MTLQRRKLSPTIWIHPELRERRSKRAKTSDASADAADLLLSLSKHLCSNENSRAQSSCVTSQQPVLDRVHSKGLRPPYILDPIHVSEDEEDDENTSHTKLMPTKLKFLDREVMPVDLKFLDREDDTEGRRWECQDRLKSLMGSPMPPAPRLPNVPAGFVFKPRDKS